MGGSKHWILYLALLSTVAISIEGEEHEECQLVNRLERNPETDRQWRILCELSRTFGDYRPTKSAQYGVLYLPPPADQPLLLPSYQPEQPTVKKLEPKDPNFVDPPVTSPFPHNYAVTIPKEVPNEVTQKRKKKNKIHTEDTLFNNVYPKMLAWYRDRWNKPIAVYLYTYFTPCLTTDECRDKSCTTIIEEFAKKLDDQIPLYVGYSKKYDETECENSLTAIEKYLINVPIPPKPKGLGLPKHGKRRRRA